MTARALTDGGPERTGRSPELRTRTRLGANARAKIGPEHLARAAYVYVRQSSPYQVAHNVESKRRQYERVQWVTDAGWPPEQIVVVDGDQGTTAALPGARSAFAQMAAAVASAKPSFDGHVSSD